MPKRIAIAPHLINVRSALEQRGFQTVAIDDTDQAIHAMIYSTQSDAGGNIPHGESLAISGNNKFVILINADEYTPDEIVDIVD